MYFKKFKNNKKKYRMCLIVKPVLRKRNPNRISVNYVCVCNDLYKSNKLVRPFKKYI